jgi:hypothetical protein
MINLLILLNCNFFRLQIVPYVDLETTLVLTGAQGLFSHPIWYIMPQSYFGRNFWTYTPFLWHGRIVH